MSVQVSLNQYLESTEFIDSNNVLITNTIINYNKIKGRLITYISHTPIIISNLSPLKL